MTLLIVTPLFEPATGGASTYYRLLTDILLQGEDADRIHVVTGAVDNAPRFEENHDGRLAVHRIFPRVATAQHGLRQYARYALQNVLYARLPAIVDRRGVDVVLAHSSFHNYPNVFSPVIRWIARFSECRLIADVRDCLLPRRRLEQLVPYDQIIACSMNVETHLNQHDQLAPEVTRIPVIQESIDSPSTEEIRRFRREHGIPDVPYICYVGLIKAEKGVRLLLDAYHHLTGYGSDVHLVLAGQMKGSSELRERIDAASSVHHLGVISRKDVFALQTGASLCANLSPSEGLPRASLEAMALGTPVILPSGVPEFERHCPEHVIEERTPVQVSQQLNSVLETSQTSEYPVERHAPNRVVESYRKVLRGREPS
jgi:glycosyltransferase involved in cell wall biosynthesis